MLRDRATSVLSRAETIAQRHVELTTLGADIADERVRLAEPMRVAIAGRVSAGKSTCTGALLDAELSATGVEETTFNVVEFQYGNAPSFDVRYKSGAVERIADLAELGNYVARRSGGSLAEISRVCVSYPNELLRLFRLLDLPGLGSVFETDSLNAMERLGIDPEGVTRASLEGVDQADAVVYLFNKAVAVSDAEIVREFGGSALDHLSPVKAIGVLSRVDNYWPPQRGGDLRAEFDPLDRATAIADRYLTSTRAADIFYDIRPVIAKLSVGAATATAQDLAEVRCLARVDRELLFRRVRDPQRFAAKEFADIPVARDARARLIGLFGAYGVYCAAGLASEGASDEDIRGELRRRSGVPQLRDVIVAHFGNRADLIKLGGVLGRLDCRRAALRPTLRGEARQALFDIGRLLGELRASEHGFRELDALHSHYALRAARRQGSEHGALDDRQAAEFLRVTGEHGLACADRLGCPHSANTERLLETAQARLAYWRHIAIDPTTDRSVLTLVDFLTAAYELLWHHVREAQRHLAFGEEPVALGAG